MAGYAAGVPSASEWHPNSPALSCDLADISSRTPMGFRLFTYQHQKLKIGDSWAATRTVRYTSAQAEIDMQDDDKFVYTIDKQNDTLQVLVSRHQLGTHLSSGVFIPAPAGEPERWTIPINPDGALTPTSEPQGKLESILCKLVVAAWNGPDGPKIDSLIKVGAIDPTHETISYDETPIYGKAQISGTAILEKSTLAPREIHLKGTNVLIPGGAERVDIRVDYDARKLPSKRQIRGN